METAEPTPGPSKGRPLTFIREIEPMPKKGPRASRGSGTRCGFCHRTGHTSRKDCEKYQDYKARKAKGLVGRPGRPKRSKVPATRATRPARRSATPPSSPVAFIRAAIAEKQRQLAALEQALAVLEG